MFSFVLSEICQILSGAICLSCAGRAGSDSGSRSPRTDMAVHPIARVRSNLFGIEEFVHAPAPSFSAQVTVAVYSPLGSPTGTLE